MRKALAMQNLIKTYNLPLVPAGVNVALERIGILEKIRYRSTTGSEVEKFYHALTTAGQKYGINQSTMHEFRTEPRYFVETFPELMSLVVERIAADVARLGQS